MKSTLEHKKILISEMGLHPGDMILLHEYDIKEWSFFVYVSRSPENENCHILFGTVTPSNELWECCDNWFDSWVRSAYHQKHNIQDHVEVVKL